jgi:hypothetical protein
MANDLRDDDLLRLLQGESGLSPEEHPWRTPHCLSTLEFLPPISSSTWSSDEAAHVESCRYCQRMIGIGWRSQCPGLLDLARYVSDPGTFRFRDAMAFHLEHDRCDNCTAWLTNKVFQTLVGLRTAAAGLAASVMVPEALMGSTDAAAVLESRAASPDVPFTQLAMRDDDEDLIVYLHAEDPRLAGRRVTVQVLGAEGAESKAALFEGLSRPAPAERPIPGVLSRVAAVAECNFGPLTDVTLRLGGELIITSQLDAQEDAADGRG